MKKLLFTGASGFLGININNTLESKKFHIYILLLVIALWLIFCPIILKGKETLLFNFNRVYKISRLKYF